MAIKYNPPMKMNFFKKLNLWFLILIVGVSKSTLSQEKLGIAFLPADESYVSIFIVLDELPEQYFLFTVPEIITSKNFKQGMFNADRKPWNRTRTSRMVVNFRENYFVRI